MDLRPNKTVSKSKNTDSGPERTDLRPENDHLRPERDHLRPKRAEGGVVERRNRKKPCVET